MLMVMPVIWGVTMTALKNTDVNLLEVARSYKMSRLRKIKYIYIPSAMPSWSSGCFTSIGLAWKAGIAAEVLCVPAFAIGTHLYNSKVYLETPSLFAWTAVVIILSFILEKLFLFIFNRPRKNSEGGGAEV